MGGGAVTTSTLRGHAPPVLTLLVVLGIGLVTPPGQLVLGLVVISPMVAAILLSPRATAGYGAVALVCGALLGIYDQQYGGETLGIQLTRLVLIVVGAAAAVGACRVRRRGEPEAPRLAAERAAARAPLRRAETIQPSLRTVPPQLPRLATAVRC